MAVLLDVDLSELMTPKSCSLIVKQLIKYIAYNTQQIPYTYDGFKHLMNSTKKCIVCAEGIASSIKLMKAKRLYNQIETQFTFFENTLTSIEQELVECDGVKEVLIVLGTTLSSPKSVFKIQIPQLNNKEEFSENIGRKILCNLYRKILNNYDSIFSKNLGLTNTFILLKMAPEIKPKSDWFIPKNDFNISSKVHPIVIYFNNCPLTDSTLPDDCRDMLEDMSYVESKSHTTESSIKSEGCAINSSLTRDEHFPPAVCLFTEDPVQISREMASWYQTKEMLKGLNDCKIDGVSVFNVISDLCK